MPKHDMPSEELKAGFFRALRRYTDDPEVMEAWGSADITGQIPDDASVVIHRFEMRWVVEDEQDARWQTAGVASVARHIAEGKFNGPDDPAILTWIEDHERMIRIYFK